VATDIEVALDDIPSQDPEAAARTAAIYAEAYPKMKEGIRSLLTKMKENPALQTPKATEALAHAAIELIIMSTRTTDLRKVNPVKMKDGYMRPGFQVPFRTVSYKAPIEPEDREATLIIDRATQLMDTLDGVPIFSGETDHYLCERVHRRQIEKAESISERAYEKEAAITKQIITIANQNPDSPALAPLEQKAESAEQYTAACKETVQRIKDTPLTDATEAKSK